MVTRIRNVKGAFSRAVFSQLRKTHPCYLAVFTGLFRARIVISTASSNLPLTRCGFGWKAHTYSSTSAFFAHAHQIPRRLVHSLWSRLRLCPSLLAHFPQLPQASTATTVFI